MEPGRAGFPRVARLTLGITVDLSLGAVRLPVARHAGERFVAPRIGQTLQVGLYSPVRVKIKVFAAVHARARRMRGVVPFGNVPIHPGFKNLLFIVEDGELPRIGGYQSLLAGDARDEAFFSAFVTDGHHALDPLQAGPEIRAHRLAEAGSVYKVSQVHARARIESAAAGQFRRRARRGEISERIRGAFRVAPEPVDLPAIWRGNDGVLPHHLPVEQRAFQWRGFADHHAVAINPLPRDAVQPLGHVKSVDFDRRFPAARWLQLHAAIAKAVLRVFITVASDVKIDLVPGQTRFIEGGDPVAVRPQRNVVHGSQFDERNAASGLLVHNRDSEQVLVGGMRGADEEQADRA